MTNSIAMQKPLKLAGLLVTAFLFSFLALSQALAVDIKTVVSEKGIKALLVEDYTVPLIAVSFAFEGGSTQDNEGKEGTSELLTNMLDEGAGDLDSRQFQEALDDIGMTYSFNSSLDSFSGGIKTLKENAPRSFELLALMLNKPRFDAEPLDRMKAARINGLKRDETNPESITSNAMREALYPSHPYGRPSNGTLETMAALSSEDLADYRNRVFARDNLVIGVVGAISEAELRAMLDQVFGDLPEKAQLKSVPEVEPVIGTVKHVELDTPQTNIRMVLPGVKRNDPEFFASYMMNYVLGGGSFSSRLYEEVREKRGLAYGVYSYIGTYEHSAFLGIGTATRTERTQQAVDVILSEVERMAKDGPTAEELEKARKYIIGSYAISNLDTSSKIAGVLVAIQTEELGTDYIDKRAEYLSAVTLEDVKKAAQRLLAAKPTIITVGKQNAG